MLSYNIYLFITKDGSKNFGIVGIQINNTLNVKIETFIKKEETDIIEAKFKSKTWTILETDVLRNFNSYRITIKAESIIVMQKNQVEKLVFTNIKDNAKKQQYMEQCICRAFIISICQPKAIFDYSIITQL